MTKSLESAVRHFLFVWDRGDDIDDALASLRKSVPQIELYRAIYTSRSLLSPEDDYNLIEDCVRNNAEVWITGVLMRHEQHYIQVLEGNKADVMALLEIIKQDKRHTDFLLVRSDNVSERIFHGWSMGSAAISPAEFKMWQATFEAGNRYIDRLLSSFFEGRYRK